MCAVIGCALANSGAIQDNEHCWMNGTGVLFDTGEALGPAGRNIVVGAVAYLSGATS